MRTALVRLPSEALAGCELTHVERRPIEFARALAQHAAYCAALEAAGLRVRSLEPLEGAPDAVFVEDPALVLDDVAILTRPGAPSRRVETAALAPVLAEYRELAHLEAPCTLEGGDVLRVEDVLFVGQSTRTNHAGLRALAHLVLAHGYRVKAAAVRGCLHLKTACTYLGDGTLLANPAWVDLQRAQGLRVLEVAEGEPFAANTLRVGDTVWMSADAPRTAELVSAAGFDVRALDVSEFRKAEAGLTCLSLVFEG